MTKTAPPDPAPTGRRLVEMLLVASKHAFFSDSDFGGVPGAQFHQVKQYDRGDILPPGLDPVKAEQLTAAGMLTRIIVRL